MRSTKKPAKSKPERSEDYERFEALTKALVSVPKAEIQLEAEKYRKARESRRSA